MATVTPSRATLDDLLRVEGKAELIGGRIVNLMPTGHEPNQVAGRIYRRLADFVDDSGRGHAYTDNMGFTVPELRSGRESFSPDAAYFEGSIPPDEMLFVAGPPAFAVEVRSRSDRGPAAERAMAAKRADYFEAGTLVVWDVDPVAETIAVYRSASPTSPTVYTKGTFAEAEPAVSGWTIDVNWVFKV
jgi:Uma2 family endonuclease